MTYRFTSGKNVGKTQAESLSKVQRPGGQFVWRLQLAPSLVGYLREAPEGEIDMPAVEGTSEGALVHSIAGNPFLPKTRNRDKRFRIRKKSLLGIWIIFLTNNIPAN